jgi:hypothetical protein
MVDGMLINIVRNSALICGLCDVISRRGHKDDIKYENVAFKVNLEGIVTCDGAKLLEG